jgi:hypothetical protein
MPLASEKLDVNRSLAALSAVPVSSLVPLRRSVWRAVGVRFLGSLMDGGEVLGLEEQNHKLTCGFHCLQYLCGWTQKSRDSSLPASPVPANWQELVGKYAGAYFLV